MCCLMGGADAQTRKAGNRSRSAVKKTTVAPDFKMQDAKWSRRINTNQDISKMTYEELYYLRALIYASHGQWYTDGEVAQMLAAKASWYDGIFTKRVDALYNKTDDPTQAQLDALQKPTALTQAEKNFVAKIDERMKALQTQTMEGRTLESTQMCVNMCQLLNPSEEVMTRLDKYNFAVEKTDCEQLFNIYEQNDYNMMPNFVTTDAFLQVTHLYLSYVQKVIEQQHFTRTLGNTLKAIHSQAMRDAETLGGAEAKRRAEFVATYAAVGMKLLTEEALTVPASYKEPYDVELQCIEKGEAVPSYLMQTKLNFDYSLFRPRGHYTRSEDQKRFFKAMMWTQTARFEAGDDAAVKRAFALALTYNELQDSIRAGFEHMGDVITQLTGESDNVSILQMAKYLKQMNISDANAIDNVETYNMVLAEMKRLNSEQNRLSSKAVDETGFYINLMPQRFVVDNDILHNMADATPNAELPFPRALDVFDAFGSKSAEDLVFNFYKDDKKWNRFATKMDSLKAIYSGKPVGMGTIYDRRLQILVDMSKEHPQKLDFAFYNTPDWQKKELNTALASWATLKHDAILYAEQPELAECGGGDELPPPMPMGFVEPNVKFWNELSSIVSDTEKWLNDAGYLDDALKEKTEMLSGDINFCKGVAEKEVKGVAPSYEDRETIKGIGSSLEWISLGLIDPSLELMSWNDIQGADRCIAQIADVFTRNVVGCDKCGVLYSACGNANVIYVLVKINGKTYLTRGGVYGYHEFVRPQNLPRLTDEEWQKELQQGKDYMPEWMKPYIINGKVKTDERNFYGTGC